MRRDNKVRIQEMLKVDEKDYLYMYVKMDYLYMDV